MLEIRIIDSMGQPTPTLEDVNPPSIVKGATNTSGPALILADYCFNDEGTFLVWKQNLAVSEMAAACFTKLGNLESLVVSEKKVEDPQEKDAYMRYLAHNCLMTRYPAKEGKEVFLFYIPPYRQQELEKAVKGPVRRLK